MRSIRLGPLFALGLLLFATIVEAQQPSISATPVRDATAVALLQQSMAAMATTAPSDSAATGSLTLVEGSTNETGTITIQTHGTGETAETITLPDGQRVVIYNNGDAKEVNGTNSVIPTLQLIVVDQCADFPLPLLSAFVGNPDEAFRYVGQETLDGVPVQHIQVWNSFASKPRMQKLAPFSVREIWLDAGSYLPVKVAYSRRVGGGAYPAIPVAITFSNYKNVSGVLYPFQIKKSYNGTPWQTVTIQSVSFNTGLTDAQFETE